MNVIGAFRVKPVTLLLLIPEPRLNRTQPSILASKSSIHMQLIRPDREHIGRLSHHSSQQGQWLFDLVEYAVSTFLIRLTDHMIFSACSPP